MKDGDAMGPETTLIVRVFNEEKHLPDLFDALDRQDYRDFHTVVVDSGSYDRSLEIAERRADKVIRITNNDFTFGYSINVGIAAASSTFIVIVSAHTMPCDATWLENLIAPLRENDIAMSYGRQLGVASSCFSEVEDFKRTFDDKPATELPSNFRANNANSAIRYDLWRQYNFDEDLPGLEDIDWAKHWMSEGYRVVYRPDAALFHVHEESWQRVSNRYYHETAAARRIGIQNRKGIATAVIQEAVKTVVDLKRAFRSIDNPVCERLGLGKRLQEVLQFRFHKNRGMIRAMIEPHPMETHEQRRQAFFETESKAMVIHEPKKAQLELMRVEELKPGDALIRVAHVAVCATDLEILDGSLGYYKNGMADYPIVPGHEFSGHVVAMGQNVTGLKEQDPVVAECIQSCGACADCRSGNFIGCVDRAELGVFRRNGAYAQYVVVPAKFVHPLPARSDMRAAALCEPVAVVLKGLRRIDAQLRTNGAPARCAVLGAGPIGHLCALLLARRGHRVTAFDRNPKRRACFDGSAVETASNLENLKHFNLIVEATGDPEVLHEALHQSPASAALLLLGLPYAQRNFSFETIAAYDKTVIGSVGSTAEDFEEAIRLLPELDLSAFFECEMTLDEAPAAWELARKGDVLKIILKVS